MHILCLCMEMMAMFLICATIKMCENDFRVQCSVFVFQCEKCSLLLLIIPYIVSCGSVHEICNDRRWANDAVDVPNVVWNWHEFDDEYTIYDMNYSEHKCLAAVLILTSTDWYGDDDDDDELINGECILHNLQPATAAAVMDIDIRLTQICYCKYCIHF